MFRGVFGLIASLLVSTAASAAPTPDRNDASLAERIARAQATIVKLEQLGSGEWTLRRDQNSEETQLAQYWNNWHNHWNNWHNHWNNWHNHWGNHHHHN